MTDTQVVIKTRAEFDTIMATGPFFGCSIQARDGGERYYSAVGGLIIVYPSYKTIVHQPNANASWSKVDADTLSADEYREWLK